MSMTKVVGWGLFESKKERARRAAIDDDVRAAAESMAAPRQAAEPQGATATSGSTTPSGAPAESRLTAIDDANPEPDGDEALLVELQRRTISACVTDIEMDYIKEQRDWIRFLRESDGLTSRLASYARFSTAILRERVALSRFHEPGDSEYDELRSEIERRAEIALKAGRDSRIARSQRQKLEEIAERQDLGPGNVDYLRFVLESIDPARSAEVPASDVETSLAGTSATKEMAQKKAIELLRDVARERLNLESAQRYSSDLERIAKDPSQDELSRGTAVFAIELVKSRMDDSDLPEYRARDSTGWVQLRGRLDRDSLIGHIFQLMVLATRPQTPPDTTQQLYASLHEITLREDLNSETQNALQTAFRRIRAFVDKRDAPAPTDPDLKSVEQRWYESQQQR